MSGPLPFPCRVGVTHRVELDLGVGGLADARLVLGPQVVVEDDERVVEAVVVVRVEQAEHVLQLGEPLPTRQQVHHA